MAEAQVAPAPGETVARQNEVQNPAGENGQNDQESKKLRARIAEKARNMGKMLRERFSANAKDAKSELDELAGGTFDARLKELAERPEFGTILSKGFQQTGTEQSGTDSPVAETPLADSPVAENHDVEGTFAKQLNTHDVIGAMEQATGTSSAESSPASPAVSGEPGDIDAVKNFADELDKTRDAAEIVKGAEDPAAAGTKASEETTADASATKTADVQAGQTEAQPTTVHDWIQAGLDKKDAENKILADRNSGVITDNRYLDLMRSINAGTIPDAYKPTLTTKDFEEQTATSAAPKESDITAEQRNTPAVAAEGAGSKGVGQRIVDKMQSRWNARQGSDKGPISRVPNAGKEDPAADVTAGQQVASPQSSTGAPAAETGTGTQDSGEKPVVSETSAAMVAGPEASQAADTTGQPAEVIADAKEPKEPTLKEKALDAIKQKLTSYGLELAQDKAGVLLEMVGANPDAIAGVQAVLGQVGDAIKEAQKSGTKLSKGELAKLTFAKIVEDFQNKKEDTTDEEATEAKTKLRSKILTILMAIGSAIGIAALEVGKGTVAETGEVARKSTSS